MYMIVEMKWRGMVWRLEDERVKNNKIKSRDFVWINDDGGL